MEEAHKIAATWTTKKRRKFRHAKWESLFPLLLPLSGPTTDWEEVSTRQRWWWWLEEISKRLYQMVHSVSLCTWIGTEICGTCSRKYTNSIPIGRNFPPQFLLLLLRLICCSSPPPCLSTCHVMCQRTILAERLNRSCGCCCCTFILVPVCRLVISMSIATLSRNHVHVLSNACNGYISGAALTATQSATCNSHKVARTALEKLKK